MENIKLAQGRLAMTENESELLAQICQTPGDHVEVGVLWGATSIIAALNKPDDARLYAIDIMERGFWVDGDPGAPNKAIPTARAILDNFAKSGIAHKMTLICANSFPFPIPSVNPSTALIDAGHGIEAITHDWDSLKDITTKYIALHDYGIKHPQVMEVIDNTILKDPEWCKYEQADSLLVMRKL